MKDEGSYFESALWTPAELTILLSFAHANSRSDGRVNWTGITEVLPSRSKRSAIM